MKRHRTGAIIHHVEPGGIGAELGLAPGDRILRINGCPLNDLIDYSMLVSDELVELQIQRSDGEIWEIDVEKEEDEGLGLDFEDAVFDGITPCGNRCVFCFVDQMPKGQRPSLYVKDDDYRLSFLQGSYITLTNLRAKDWERLERLRLSPLYISVHATTPAVRQFLLGQKRAGEILDDLKRLSDMGIRCHTQAVLCPGVNDGAILEATLRDLFNLWPSVQSLAIVPVGLTKCRDGLSPLRRFTQEEAEKVIQTVEAWQEHCAKLANTRWVWATDEFYIQAGRALPDYETYEEFEQLENGVGLWRLLEREIFDAVQTQKDQLHQAVGSFGIVTGKDAAVFWEKIRSTLLTFAPQLKLKIYPVINNFFGTEVSVAGLVTGADIIASLSQIVVPEEEILLVPQVMIRRGETVFLDGVTIVELENAVGRRVKVVEVDGESFVGAICTSPKEDKE